MTTVLLYISHSIVHSYGLFNCTIELCYYILLLIDRAIRRNWVMLDSLVE